MVFQVTAFYLGLNALILLWLGVRVIRRRHRLQAGYGDAGDPDLMRAMRGHGNAAEYMPLAILLMAAVESMGGPLWLVHALGATFTAGRLIHGYAFCGARRLGFRVAGMAATLTVYGVGAISVIALALTA